jgi:nucleotide-binding universal stress UspA family protein
MNFQRFLLPLDGSDLAEVAIPPAVYLARIYGASLTLLHVVESSAPSRIHGGSRHITDEQMAREYLQRIANSCCPEGTDVEIHVHSAAVRDVAKSIVHHILECQADVVVMCAHGKDNPRQWLLGNNAQQILARGGAPVFFLPNAYHAELRPFAIETVILPVDAKPEHSSAAEWAESLAQHSRATLELVTVVPTVHTLSGAQAATRTLLPSSTAALLEISVESARKILENHTQRVRAGGTPAENSILRGDPAEELIKLAGRHTGEVMVLGSHANAGNAAFWNRSVTARILQKISIPALLIPVTSKT